MNGRREDDNSTSVAETVAVPASETGGYNPDFYADLDAIEDGHFWFRTRRLIIATLAHQITQHWTGNYNVLEAGCGNGSLLSPLQQACPGGRVIGLDLCFEGLPRARRRTSCPLVQGTTDPAPFVTTFRMIGMFDVLEHIPDDLATMRSVNQLLLPSGTFLIAVPAHMSLWSYFDVAGKHCRRYSPAELREKLHAAGFEVEYLTQFMSFLYPMMWLSRRLTALRRRISGKSDPPIAEISKNDLKVPRCFNGVLTCVFRAEARLLQRRWTLPVGTSLLAIARKRSV